MGDTNDALEALADVVATVVGRAKPYLDENINPPDAHCFTRTYDPRLTLGGSPKRMLAASVRVFVKRIDLRSAQLSIRNYMDQAGETSIRAAVENGDLWPDGLIDDVEVVQVGEPFEVGTGDAAYFAIDFDVDIIL